MMTYLKISAYWTLLKVANLLLFGLGVILLVLYIYFSVCAVSPLPVAQAAVFQIPVEVKALENRTVKVLSPEDFLLTRSLFQSGSGDATPSPVLAVFDDRQDLLKDLRLVGILDDNGIQAIIEDCKTSKSYYLRNGEMMSGFLVVDIRGDAVLLESDGQQFTLKL